MHQGQELPSGQPLWSGILLEVRIIYSIVMNSNLLFVSSIVILSFILSKLFSH